MVTLLCLRPVPSVAAAANVDIFIDLPLRPLTQPPSAQLSAYSCLATVECDGEGSCAVRTRQRYQLALSPGTPASTMRLGLPAEALDRRTAPTDIALRDEQGNALPIASHDADVHAIWEVAMTPGQPRTLELSYRHPASTAPLIIWSWEVAALSAWGTVAAVHGEFVLPVPMGDDALLRVAPHRANLEGGRLWWDYEATDEYQPHHIVVVAPPVWERLQTARASGAHADVAALLRSLQAAADTETLPGIDYSAEIAGELLAALQDDPGNTAARTDLAATYRTLAARRPENRLNYLLLAAHELAVALEQSGGTGGPSHEALAVDLGRTYLEAASAASEAGDPAGALEYLALAREAAGPALAEELADADELTLRWALKLAEMGRLEDALAALDGRLSSELYEGLRHYAPPLVAARGTVSLRPSTRTVRYELEPYPPVASAVREQVASIVRRLQQVSCCQVSLDEANGVLAIIVEAPAQDLTRLEACSADIRVALTGGELEASLTSRDEALGAGLELLTAIIVQPWQSTPSLFVRERRLGHDRWRYAERADSTALHEALRSEAEYAAWHLVELHSASPTDTRAELERQLALAVMRQQRQAWEALLPAAQWAYEVAFEDSGPPAAEWLVGWEKQCNLSLERIIPRWGDIGAAGLALAALLVLVALLPRWLRRAHRAAS